jgi:Holliday junction DNA helicase RuvA
MIGKITGNLVYNVPPRIMIDVCGIAYEIDVPMSTIYELPPLNSIVSLHTQLIIKEDSHNLYGFLSISEKHLFKELIRISGVGARTALAILSGLSIQEVISAVSDNRVGLLSTIPGIGKKTAERLILELSNRLHILNSYREVNFSLTADKLLHISNNIDINSIKKDTINALLALGYGEKEANNSIKNIADIDNMELGQAIKKALNILSGK